MRNMLPTVAALASAATAASLLPSDVTSLAAPSKTLSISFPQPTGGKNVEVEHPGEVLAPNGEALYEFPVNYVVLNVEYRDVFAASSRHERQLP